MEKTLCAARGNSDKPAGGLQLIFAGDFVQLPPVYKRPDPRAQLPADAFTNFGLAFQAPAWRRLKLQCVELTRVYRQVDGDMVDMLQAIRSAPPRRRWRGAARPPARRLPSAWY